MNRDDFFIARTKIPGMKRSKIYAYKVNGYVFPRKGYGVFALGGTKYIVHLKTGFILSETTSFGSAQDMIRLQSPIWDDRMNKKIKRYANQPISYVARSVKAISRAYQEGIYES